uniref:MIF4G domain-containing protein n=1 Tax=viral metagenome TaxID=1070528 RepID=A0A6C0FDJ8_9ZZZZ
MTYTISDFQSISSNGFNVVLPNNTIELINSLSKHVGSPSYIKTPVFNKRENTGNDTERKRRRKFKAQDTSWGDNLKNDANTKSNIVFKAPTPKKTLTIVESTTQSVRSILNKIGTSNTDSMVSSLIEIIDDMLECGDDITGEDVHNISENITNVMSSNSFYSDVYSQIYVYLLDKYSFIQETLQSKLTEYIPSYNNVIDVNPDENYDLFCSKNKENDIRRANTLFFTNLSKHHKIESSILVDFIMKLCEKIASNIQIPDSITMIDEMIENISIILSNNKEIYKELDKKVSFSDDKDINTIGKYLLMLSKTKPKTFAGLSTKSLFKLMEIMEELET